MSDEAKRGVAGGKGSGRNGRIRPKPRHDPVTADVRNAATLPRAPRRRWAACDFVTEAVEMAGLKAEASVHPFLASRTEPSFAGVSAIEIRFLDDATERAFRRTKAARFVRKSGSWFLARRWAEAGGDGSLDEEMCRVVARCLNTNFAGRLQAEVVTWFLRDHS